MGTEDFTDKFQGLKIKENQDVNILLLGETGVGKSTFVNAIANYLHFKSFKKAAKEELLILVPSVITVTNENYEQVTISVGSDNNEYQEIGAAGTQDVKTYVFPIGEGKTRLRLIDSPGMGDPRGIEQDDINCENILAYLAQLKELHAICFLMKPTTTRITVLFEYCMKQILSRLEKSASKNLIFIFTNTRGTNYSPGDTLPCLKAVADGIKAKPPHVDIPLKTNIFSLDNEAFRFLVAMKRDIKFDEHIKERFVESWNNSSKECWRLISYIVGDASRDPLRPHQMHNTVSINEARRLIVQLSQPLADISQLIYDNIRILDRHTYNLKIENQSLDELKNNMFIPIIKLEVTQLTQPVTVCTSPKCAELVKVGEIQKWHYGQRCHDPCYLTNVTKEIVGDNNLINCTAMNGGRTCVKCTCDYKIHMHVYYMTKTVDDKIVDDAVLKNIQHKETALREAERLIRQIDQRKTELEEERETIIKSTAQFAHFLQHNAISPFNDSYKVYIEYLITREKSLGRNSDQGVINNLEQLLKQYEEIKAAFDHSLSLNQKFGLNEIVSSSITAPSIMNTIAKLYHLKHNGKKINELFKKQKASRNYEYDKNCEYVHPETTGFQSSGNKKDKSKKDKKKDGNNTGAEGKKDKSKKDKKKDGITTDDDKKDKSKKKYATDDERKDKFKKGPSKGPFPNREHRPYNQGYQIQPPPLMSSYPYSSDLPPPYPGHDSRTYKQQPSYSSHEGKSDNEPDVIVKVELNQLPNKYQKNSQQHYYNSPQQGSYGQSGSSYYYDSYGQYHGPPQGQYQGPPQGQYQGPPHHGPPQGTFHGPPQGQYQEPPQGQYYGPPQGQYHGPPQGQYHGPPRGQYRGPPQHQHQPYQKHTNKPNEFSGRGRPYNKRGGYNNRGRSKSHTRNDKKSGNEKSGRSSDSESSSD